jgi:hypothetical protein
MHNNWLKDSTSINPGTSNLVAHYEFEDNTNDSTSATPEQNGVKYGDSSYTTGQIGSKALGFDPTDANDYVVVDDYAGTIDAEFIAEAFSISLWMKTTLASSDDHLLCNGTDGGSYGSGSASGKNYRVFFVNSALMQFKMDDNVQDTSVSIGSGLVATGDWVHVAAVRNTADDVLELYVDGARAGIATDNTGDINSPNEPLIIGGKVEDVNENDYTYTVEGFYTGELDDLRIYDKALTLGEVVYLALEGGATPDELKYRADLNLDNVVDLEDYAILSDKWLETILWP